SLVGEFVAFGWIMANELEHLLASLGQSVSVGKRRSVPSSRVALRRLRAVVSALFRLSSLSHLSYVSIWLPSRTRIILTSCWPRTVRRRPRNTSPSRRSWVTSWGPG